MEGIWGQVDLRNITFSVPLFWLSVRSTQTNTNILWLMSTYHLYTTCTICFFAIAGCVFIMNLSYSPADFKCLLTEECIKVLPSTFQVCLAKELSSRKVKEELFLLSDVPDRDQQTVNLGSRCSFATFITQNEHDVRIETVRGESLCQVCIDQLHCQQYIRVL